MERGEEGGGKEGGGVRQKYSVGLDFSEARQHFYLTPGNEA